MKHSESTKEIFGALVKLQAKLKPAPMDKVNPFFNSPYASYESCRGSCQAEMAELGLAVLHFPAIVEGKPALECVLAHSSGEWVSETTLLNPTKNDPQALGSAITYMKRYSFSALVGQVTGDDDDGNAATAPSTQVVQKRTAAPPAAGQPAASRQNSPQRPANNIGGAVDRVLQNARPQGGGGDKSPTEKQLNRMFAIATSKGVDDEQLHVLLSDKWGIASAKDLNRQQYDTFCNYLLNLRGK